MRKFLTLLGIERWLLDLSFQYLHLERLLDHPSLLSNGCQDENFGSNCRPCNDEIQIVGGTTHMPLYAFTAWC